MILKSPSSLEEWLIFLQNKRFPVAADNLKQISRHLSAPDEALDKMHKHITREPFVGFMAISVANKMITSNRGDIKTPVHAASMIGMNGLLRITQKLYPCNFAKDNKAHQEFLRQLQISYESATIAKYWSIERRNANNDEIFWTTFYRDAVRWLLWFYAYDEMSKMTTLMENGVHSKAAEEEIFNCRIDQLAVKLFHYWNIPNTIINTFMTAHTPSVKELKTLAALTENTRDLPLYSDDKRIIFLANSDIIFSVCATQIAQLANQKSWNNKTLEIYFRAISTALHCKHSDTVKATHTATVEAAEIFSDGSKIPLACQLLEPFLYGMGTTESDPKSKQDDSVIAQLQETLAGNNITHKDCLVNAIKTIRNVIPTGHQTLVLSYQDKIEKLKTSFQYGFDTNILKQVQWDSNTVIMQKLMSKRSAILIDKNKLDLIRKQLPSLFLGQIKQNQQLILASCRHQNGDWTIFWVATNQLFSDNDFNNLKRILTLVNKRLS